MRKGWAALLAMACAFTVCSPAHASSEDDWATASDVVRAALMLAALGTPVVKEDWQGARQAGASLGAAYVVTEGLKQTFPTMRPDGSDNRSFPSSHTSLSFAAAATIDERLGRTAGIVAHVAAAFVGVARVEARKHRWGDVIVGAAIGEVAGRIFTRHPGQNVAIMPWGDTHGGGIAVVARF